MLIPLGILDYPVSAAAGSYDLLETEILTGSQASVTFSSLNSTYGAGYQHLQVRMVGISPSDVSYLRFNGVSGTSYRNHGLRGNGSTVSSYASGAAAGQIQLSTVLATDTTYTKVIDILDAFDSNKNTTIRALVANSNQGIELISGVFMNTSALTSILLAPFSGTYSAGSRFSLYGLKGA